MTADPQTRFFHCLIHQKTLKDQIQSVRNDGKSVMQIQTDVHILTGKEKTVTVHFVLFGTST